MKIWREYEVDEILKKAHEKGVILSGLSAGSICWFKYGNSDSRKLRNKNAKYIKVKGLNLLNALNCPHYDFEKQRKPDLKRMMKKSSGIAIALENCCAIEVVEDEYRIISSKKNANAYKVFWKNKKYHEELIEKRKEFSRLNELLKK